MKMSFVTDHAQDRTSSPTHAAHHQVTGRSRDGHEDQQVQQQSFLKDRGRSVTTKSSESVTDLLRQNCYRCLETSQSHLTAVLVSWARLPTICPQTFVFSCDFLELGITENRRETGDFDSLQSRATDTHRTFNPWVVGSSPTGPTLKCWSEASLSSGQPRLGSPARILPTFAHGAGRSGSAHPRSVLECLVLGRAIGAHRATLSREAADAEDRTEIPRVDITSVTGRPMRRMPYWARSMKPTGALPTHADYRDACSISEAVARSRDSKSLVSSSREWAPAATDTLMAAIVAPASLFTGTARDIKPISSS